MSTVRKHLISQECLSIVSSEFYVIHLAHPGLSLCKVLIFNVYSTREKGEEGRQREREREREGERGGWVKSV